MAWANEPNPPRVTPPEPESDELPDPAWLDAESLLKKLEREDHDPPWPPPDEVPRCEQSVPVTAAAATPGAEGWQFWRGISA